MRTRSKRLAAALVVALAALAVVAASVSGPGSRAREASMTPYARETAKWKALPAQLARAAGGALFPCQTAEPPTCYGPTQIRAAYGIQPLLDHGLTGAGRTIVIIESFGSPTIASDLAAFDSLWGLPAPPRFRQVAPFGVDSTDPDTAAGWAGETSLDVEWAHAIAPGARIVLVVAKSDSDSDTVAAAQWALDHDAGDVVAQSFGEAEQCMDPRLLARQHWLLGRMARKGIAVFASTGDQGAAQYTCDDTGYFKAISTPASDPNVIAVGGTFLDADGVTGAYQSETTWNESAVVNDAEASGGGVSVVYRRPRYQTPTTGQRMRTVPDVAYAAGLQNGVVVVFGGDLYTFGGTSVGTPQWAGIIAIADQIARHRIRNVNEALYRLAGWRQSSFFHDVADGSTNSIPDLGCCGTPIDGFAAGPGYDLTTGLGSPIASALAPALAFGDGVH